MIDLSAKLVEVVLFVQCPLFQIHGHVGLQSPERVDRDIGAEHVAQLSHRVLETNHLEGRLVEEILCDHAHFMGFYIGEHREDIGGASAVARVRIVRVELIDFVHPVEQREHAAELLITLIVGGAGQKCPELVRAHEADRRALLQIINICFGRRPLHPSNLFGKLRRQKDRRLSDLGGQDQMLLARDDVQNCLVRAVRTAASHVLGIGVMISRVSLAKDRLLRLQVRIDVLDIRLVISAEHREVQVEQDLGILNDRLVDLYPELGEGIARLYGAAVVVVYKIQTVLQQLLVAVHAGVLEFSVFRDEGFDLVKILIHLLGAQTEEVFEEHLRLAHPQRFFNHLKTLFQARRCPGAALRLIRARHLQLRLVRRSGIVKPVPFRIQNTAGPFAARDLLVKDLLFIGQH